MNLSSVSIKHLHIHLPASPAPLSRELHGEPVMASTDSTTRPISRFALSGGSLDRHTMVTDHRTGLMWAAEESATRLNFAEAEKYCADLRLGDFDDWRLPDLEELESIRDITRHEPCLDTSVFKSNSSWVWSRTPTAWSPVYAWLVHFYGGSAGYGHRHYHAVVRAVRRVSPAGQ